MRDWWVNMNQTYKSDVPGGLAKEYLKPMSA